jgi:hypothetical protein
MHDSYALAQRDRRHRPTRHGCPVGCFSHLEVIHASNVLDDAGAGLVAYPARTASSNPASPARRQSRPAALAGFTKSSTTAFA